MSEKGIRDQQQEGPHPEEPAKAGVSKDAQHSSTYTQSGFFGAI